MTSYLARGNHSRVYQYNQCHVLLTASLFSIDRSRVPGQASEGRLAQGKGKGI